MKSKLIAVVTAAAATCLTLQGWAANGIMSDTQRSRDRDEVAGIPIGMPHLGNVEKGNKVIGMEVRDSQNQKLGKVKDLAIDVESGRVVEVVLSSGGFMGMGDKYVILPSALFSWDVVNKGLRADLNKDRIKTLPEFSMTNWQSSFDETQIVDRYQRFGLKPYFVANVQPLKSPTPTNVDRLGYIEKATKVMGLSAQNLQNERLGKVENLILDVPDGRIVEVVVSTGEYMGTAGELSVIPPRAFHYSPAHDALQIDTTKEALMNAPHFKSSEWPDVGSPIYVGGVYRSYNIQPYFSTMETMDADSTVQNVRERVGDRVTPLDQGNSAADMQTTAQIRKAILAHEGLSIDARNVKIITKDGHVTLRGPVNNPDERRIIAEIADGIASPMKVDNQLDVKAR